MLIKFLPRGHDRALTYDDTSSKITAALIDGLQRKWNQRGALNQAITRNMVNMKYLGQSHWTDNFSVIETFSTIWRCHFRKPQAGRLFE